MTKLKVNGTEHAVKSSPDTPLLYVLRDELGVMTPKFGCGMAQCGACSVLLDGAEIRSCITPVSAGGGQGSDDRRGPARPLGEAAQARTPTEGALHPVQEAWIEEQVPQCGICQFGMMIKVTELLEAESDSDGRRDQGGADDSGPSAHLCRCASYAAIMDGVHHAARRSIANTRAGK